MVGVTQHSSIETAKARAKLEAGRKAHFQTLRMGKAALGYQRDDDATQGRWLLRRYIGGGKYAIATLGLADDMRDQRADGINVLTFEQAKDRAVETLDQSAPGGPRGTLTVRKAFASYVTKLQSEGRDTKLTEQRAAAVILPELGDLQVAELTADRLRKWLTGMAKAPALQRSSKKEGKKQNTKAAPGKDPEAIRKRQASANRVLTMLKAALNHAYAEGWVKDASAWGKRLKGFRDVDVAKVDFIEVEEAKRLINATPADFRLMIQAALQTGARYGELCRLKVSDFSPSAGTVLIQRSKSGKARHVVLSPEGIEFFRSVTLGRKGNEIMLQHEGREWRHGEQSRAMAAACENAKLRPIGFHILRHSYGSLAAMGGMPLNALQQNLGHADMRMTTKHYAHLSPGYMKDAIRESAPRFGFKPDKKVASLRKA